MVIFFEFSCSNHRKMFLKKLPLLFVLALYPLGIENIFSKSFSKKPVQKCDFWTLGERKIFRKWVYESDDFRH